MTVWTPRRVMLLVLGTTLFAGAFLVYNRFLGWMDGLPPLPERLLSAAKPGQPFVEVRKEDRIKRMLRQAFGDGCPEVSYRYHLSLQSQGLILAMEDFEIKDGRVKLWPFSLASVGKINPRTGFPEINTVRCDEVFVTFDRPIESLSDISHSKMVAAEFTCKRPKLGEAPRYVCVVNNHATPQADDDLIAKMPGPVYFEDSAATKPDKPQLWTDQTVEVTDYQSHPPHIVKSQTLGIFLEPDALKGGDKSTKPNEHTGQIRKVELGNVHMILTVDKPSDFLAAPARPTRLPAAEPEMPILSIRTMGRFEFDLRTNKAEFAIPKEPNSLRQFVEVVRGQAAGNDELQCDRLELQFRRRTPPPAGTVPPPPPPAGPGEALEIEEARATGEHVLLSSVPEKLNAQGYELIFRNIERKATLRGSPMTALKEGNRIVAPELVLHRPDPKLPGPPPGQPVRIGRAPGPGTVFLHDSKEQRTVAVHWNDELLIDRVDDRDLITLTGQPVFDDRENGQWLKGDLIKLWMLRAPESKAGPAPASPGRAKPQRLQVTGHVQARTPELTIDDTPVLTVWFQDVQTLPPPGRSGSVSGAIVTAASGAASPPARPALGPPSALGADPAAPPKKPIEMSAEVIEAVVLRREDHAELDRVQCRARVHVRQAPDHPGERGLDLHSQTLDLTHTPDGDVLRLAGSAEAPARVEVQDMDLRGPQVLFDQRDNRADVDGMGEVKLVTRTNLNGENLERPTEVVIRWNGRMNFIGNRISFRGGVQADQENVREKDLQAEKELNRLLCPMMDVYLDRAVSFSRLHRAQSAAASAPDDKPKIRRVVCHRGDEVGETGQVLIANNLWRNGRRVRFQTIEAPEVTMENETGEMNTAGPGEMRLFQLGDPVEGGTEKPAGAPPAGQVFKLTRVKYRERMRANNRTQSATFAGQVRVYHTPTDDPNLEINPDSLPQGAFTLTCQTLEVTARTENGRRYATMVANGKADIYANDFSGRSDVIKYDESKKQQVIFQAREGGSPAALYYSKVRGDSPMELLGETIFYFRQTNEFRINKSPGMTGAR